MPKTSPTTTLKVHQAEQLPKMPENLLAFLAWLNQPTAITVTGTDASRHRVICTLLHGNEPSGAKAMHRWLSEWQMGHMPPPKTSVTFLLPSVEACLLPPAFNHRHFPNRRDLNRCFNGPTNDAEGQLAANLMAFFREVQPEAIVDLHNTSGAGPAFAVSTVLDAKHQALASFFTQQLIFTDLTLGALMELGEHFTPTVTVECGGSQDEAARILAYEGMQRFMGAKNLFEGYTERSPIKIFQHPLRLKLKAGCTIAYGAASEHSAEQAPADLTLQAQPEALNYGPLAKGTAIGWLGPKGLSALCTEARTGTAPVHQFFEMNGRRALITKQALQLFMVTPRADIAQSDCICYFAPA